MDELYLDNIDEYVNDHNKIVTYKWLSLTLGVHVNTAKQMLYHYLDHKRSESSAPLHATYLVSGRFVDSDGQKCHKVSVVREDQLEDFKAKMNLLVSVHVYSVQKALLKDSAPLYTVDYDAVKDNLRNCCKYSAIHCSSAVPMSPVELQQSREEQRSSAPEPEPKKSSVNGGSGVTSKTSAKPQKGIMGMFASKPKNQDSLREMKPERNEEAPVVEEAKSKAAAKANPVMNFFGNQTAKKSEKTVKQQQEEEKHPEAPSSSRTEPQQKYPEKTLKVTPAVPQKEAKKESGKTKRIADSDSEEEKIETKKRRRIKKPEPDSSDEDVIPASPPQMETKAPSPSPKKEPVSVTHKNSAVRIRKKRQVLKSQTFVDDEGCIVTEKGYVSESYSESEDDFKPSKQAAREPVKAKPSIKEDEKKNQKKASANKGAKQASIMGFFQKK